MRRPQPNTLATRPNRSAEVQMQPMPPWVNGWSGVGGGELHMRANEALVSLTEDKLLEKSLPEKAAIFRAFDLVPPEEVRVVCLGQDPYPAPGDAMGLAFSSNATKLPASLRNIYKEMANDLGIVAPPTGDLTHLAYQGVLLANTALTLGCDGKSHFKHWRSFTETWITALASTRPVVWILWGNHAKQWRPLIESKSAERRLVPIIIESVHPSPLSARRGFFGSKPFSRTNEGLRKPGLPPIQWEVR